jgi:serine/threonine protein kinase
MDSTNNYNIQRVKTDTKLIVNRLIRQGSYANVYLAEDSKRNQYAVKAIETKPESRNFSLYTEIQHLSVLCGHTNIVKLYRTVETDTYIYLIQECCDKDLFDVIEQGLDELTIRKLFKELCKAVAYCHSKSIYHRDLKPENILETYPPSGSFHFRATRFPHGHTNIVKLYRTVETDTYIYLIQECCDKDLFDVIEQGLDELTIRKLFKELCKAVGYCHSKSIYHRDLKPENILIKNNTLKLCDFGLSTTDSLCDEFHTGSVRYMAPEVYCDPIVTITSLKMPYVSSANDVWALGIILINMLTSRNPWECPSRSNRDFQNFRKNPQSFFKDFQFSKEFVMVLENVFQNDPFDRPNVEELSILVDNVAVMVGNDGETDSDIIHTQSFHHKMTHYFNYLEIT